MKKDYWEIAAFCKTHWQAEVQETLDFADAVCENRFLFDRPLDLERTSKTVVFPQEINWYHILDNDKEFLFQLNRHYFLISLGQAYYLTADSKYLHHLVRLLTDWITRVPRVNKMDSPWRSLEVGLRGDYWTKAMAYLEGTELDTPEVQEMYRKSLSEHAEILRSKHSARDKISNWGVIQDSGLFALAAAMGWEADAKLAANRLAEQSEIQVMADGVHWEQSCTYHAEVFSCFLNVLRIAGKHGIPLPEKLIQNTHRLATVNLMWAKPNHHQPLFGDSDDNDIRDVLTRAAMVLNRPDLKFGAYPVLDFESAWLFDQEERMQYAQMESQTPKFTDAFLEDSGTYILRTGWSETDDYLCMHNGFTGGGHAHADKLHFDLMLAGRDVLVDSGRYTYVPGKKRTAFKGGKGHNVSLVDGKSFMKISGWMYLTAAPAVQYPVYSSGECTLIGGAHLGYLKMFGSVIPERKILRIEQGLYVILDTFHARGIHRYEQYFHFCPDAEVSLNGNTATYEDGIIKAKTHFFAHGLKAAQIPSEYSAYYNTKIPNTAVQTRFWGCGNTHAITVIYGGKADDFCEYDIQLIDAFDVDSGKKQQQAQAIIIKTPVHKYTVCRAYRELTQPYACGSAVTSGTLSVFRDGEKLFTKW